MVGRKKQAAAAIAIGELLDPGELARRIGGGKSPGERSRTFGSEDIRRHDSPIAPAARARTLIADRAPRPSGRPTMIGVEEAAQVAKQPSPAPTGGPRAPGARAVSPMMIGVEEAAIASAQAASAALQEAIADAALLLTAEVADASRAAVPALASMITDEPAPEPALPSVREAPARGEIDLVATPLPTPDDWHHFELALRKLRGIGPLRTEYYRAGVLKVRVNWSGADRFANAIRSIPGYRVRILGEDRRTVQVLVGRV